MSVSYPSSTPVPSSLRFPHKRKAAPTLQFQTEQSGVPYPPPQKNKSRKSPWQKILNKLLPSSNWRTVNKARQESASGERHSSQNETQRPTLPTLQEGAQRKSASGDLYSIPELASKAASRTDWRDAEIKELEQLLKSSQKNKRLAEFPNDDDPYWLLESEEHPDAVFFRKIREKQRDASFSPKPAANSSRATAGRESLETLKASSALSTWAVMQKMLPENVARPAKFWNSAKSKDSDIMANPNVLLRECIYDPLTKKNDLILESPPSSGNASFRAAWENMRNAEDDFLLPLDPETAPVLPR